MHLPWTYLQPKDFLGNVEIIQLYGFEGLQGLASIDLVRFKNNYLFPVLRTGNHY